jgi:cell shape-determining protein MreD
LALVLFIVLVVMKLVGGPVIVALLTGNALGSVLTEYVATWQSKLADAVLWSALFVLVSRIIVGFERRPKVPGYSDRDDGYKAGRDD